ncbi:MAG: hypothetical protein ACI9XJ_002648 [Marivirga sp.]|jgi:hypothetical protein
MIRKYNFIILIALVFLSANLKAQEQKKQLFNKSYPVANKALSIDNSFGNITISLWDKKEYAVEVQLTTDGFSEKETAKLLSSVAINTSENGDEISISTDWDDLKMNTKGKKSFELNYQIKTPVNGRLNLENSFGNISVPDLKGALVIDLEYGQLSAGRLASAEIDLSFGGGSITSLQNGELDIMYADKLNIGRLGKVELESGFSNVSIESADHIDLEGKYGDIEIGTINTIKGSSSFSGLKIELLKKSFDMEAKYVSGKLAINHVDPGFESIAIESKFSQIKIVFDPQCNFTFTTEHKFGKLNHDNQIKKNFSNKEDYSADYKGYMGKENSKSKVFVATSYGDADLEIK